MTDHGAVVRRLSLDVLMDRPDPPGLSGGQVTYQAWQFHHLQSFADVTWWGDGRGDAVLCWDETSLLTDPRVRSHPCEGLFVFVCHDWWCHPLALVRELRRRPRVLMVLRHDSARRFFDLIAPELPKVVLRPGVEPSVFHPHSGEKTVDVLLSGSETPDYPVRQRLNRVVREQAAERGWSVLDLTGVGLMSGPPGSQAEYAPALAAARVSPTGTNRGGSAGASLVVQYLDHSAARADVDHPFYGLGTPDVGRSSTRHGGRDAALPRVARVEDAARRRPTRRRVRVVVRRQDGGRLARGLRRRARGRARPLDPRRRRTRRGRRARVRGDAPHRDLGTHRRAARRAAIAAHL